MKTLDEVICAIHHCGLLSGFDDSYEYVGGCPYENCIVCEQHRQLGTDILYYLTEYRRVRSQPDNCCIDDYDKPMWNPKEHWE